jgi:hypothetical protein
MDNITAYDARMIAQIFRALLEAQRQVRVLKSMLSTYAKDGDGPSCWEQDFLDLQNDNMFCPPNQQFENILKQFEEQADLKELISRIPLGTLPN